MSNPTVLPWPLTSVSCWPPVPLANPIDFFSTEVNFSVCVALCALATAGTTSAPVVPRMTAAPTAMTDLRPFMTAPPCQAADAATGGMMRSAGPVSQDPGAGTASGPDSVTGHDHH